MLVDDSLKKQRFSGRRSYCLVCEARATLARPLCQRCLDSLPYHTAAQCPVCALPLPYRGLCGQCQQFAPPYVATLALFRYVDLVPWLIKRVKFSHDLVAARLLGQLLAEAVVQREPTMRPDRIIPVPLHPSRLRQRGFNQSVELGRPIAAALGIPLDIKSSERIAATQEQAQLTARERHHNLRGAFRITHPLVGQRVVLLDDVMTTGTTLNELAQAVLRAGAASVALWVCARA
ncbi:MAG: phosphoribosyltransferase [Halothiobacillaceae bacterium]|nr:MAG: phosphoribosyltransferase [Halothiobacillaceae bacterium]